MRGWEEREEATTHRTSALVLVLAVSLLDGEERLDLR